MSFALKTHVRARAENRFELRFNANRSSICPLASICIFMNYAHIRTKGAIIIIIIMIIMYLLREKAQLGKSNFP